MDDIFNKPLCELIDRRTFLKMGGAAGLSAMLAALAIKPSLAETIITDTSIKSDAIDYTPIGAVSPSTGAFTTLKASTDPVDEHGVGDRGFNDTRYLSDIVEDTTPQLGGNLDAQSNIIQGDVENNLNAFEFGAQVLGLMTDPRLLNVMCEDPSGGYMVNAIPDGHLTSLGIAFVDSGPDTITDTGSQFVTQGFKAGNKILISGSTSNDGIYTIATVAAGTLTLVGGDALTAEAAGDRVTIDVVGTYEGTWTASDRLKQGKCWVLDPNGTNAYIDFGDSDDFSFGNGAVDSPFTIFGLIEVVNGSVQVVIGKADATTASQLREWYVSLNSSEILGFYLLDESTDALSYRAKNTALSVGWHVFVATYDGTGGATAANGITIYVDGVEVASTATNNGAYVAMENLTVPLWIGAYEGAAGNPQYFFIGDFGLTGIDAVEWSAADVWRLWQMVLAKYSENGVDLT